MEMIYWYVRPDSRGRDLRVVDTTKYDVVEKKDAKVERLKKALEVAKGKLDTSEEGVSLYLTKVKESEAEIKKLQKELDELST
jgi:peptidoglycan hydrolase CwlO-like protein